MIDAVRVARSGDGGDGDDDDWKELALLQEWWRNWSLPGLGPMVQGALEVVVLMVEPAMRVAGSQSQAAVSGADHMTPLDREMPDGPCDLSGV